MNTTSTSVPVRRIDAPGNSATAGSAGASLSIGDLAERTGAKIRKSLENYTASYLRYIWSLSATVMIVMYGLWAFEIREDHNSVWSVLSIVPFVIAVLRYSVDVDRGTGGEPEEIALGDRALQVLALAWIAMLTLAVYS